MNLDIYLSKQLKEGEELVRIVRRHPVVLVPAVGLGVILLLLNFFLISWWFQHSFLGILGFITLLIISTVLIIRGWYIWNRTVLVVTDRRLIDINQRGLFEHHVAESSYQKIQDVRYTVKGVWQTMFDFGAVIVQTAGNATNLELHGVRHPVTIQQLISDIQQRTGPGDQPLNAQELVKLLDQFKNELGSDRFNQVINSSRRHGPPPTPRS